MSQMFCAAGQLLIALQQQLEPGEQGVAVCDDILELADVLVQCRSRFFIVQDHGPSSTLNFSKIAVGNSRGIWLQEVILADNILFVTQHRRQSAGASRQRRSPGRRASILASGDEMS
jgi:hypothetical protein